LWWNEEVAEAVREKKESTENGREKIRRRNGWSIRSVGKEGYFLGKGKETEGMHK